MKEVIAMQGTVLIATGIAKLAGIKCGEDRAATGLAQQLSKDLKENPDFIRFLAKRMAEVKNK